MADAQLSFPEPAVEAPVKPSPALPVFKEVKPHSSLQPPANPPDLELLRDVELDVKIELGRVRMRVRDVLKLAQGSVLELNRLADDPVDVYVNDRLVARADVLVLNDNLCVRVCEIVAGAGRGKDAQR